MLKSDYKFFILLLPLWVCGCSSLDLQRKKIEFPNPVKILSYKIVNPNDAERKGILLRFSQPETPLFYRDYCSIYTQIREDEALAIELDKTRKLTFSDGKEKGTFYITTETSTGNKSETGSEKILVNARGEILKFINGEFKTDKGTVKFISHSRSPVFPETKVSPGDKWSYQESMEIELDSLLLSRKSTKPDIIRVDCRLEGFALVDGSRCAIISVNTITKRKELYSTLFKELNVNVNIFVKEKIFFDWEKGIVKGVVTNTESFSVSEKKDFSDHSRSQSVSIPVNPDGKQDVILEQNKL